MRWTIRRGQGVALATALSLLALVLTIGLALGTVSVMSLNLSRRGYLEARANLVARSAVAEFISQVNLLQAGQTLQLFNPQPLDLGQAFQHTELVPGCWISFDPHESRGFCTDNTGSPQWAQAWQDRGTTKTSLPPFTLELILHASAGSYQRDYRALLHKVWPYGIYSARGSLVLSGIPTSDPNASADPNPGSHVVGDVYVHTGGDPVGDSSGAGWTALSQGDMSHTSSLTVWHMLTSSFTPDLSPDAPVILGPSGTLNPSVSLTGGSPGGSSGQIPAPRSYLTAGSAGSSTAWSSATGNTLDGSIKYSDGQGRRNLQPLVAPGNSWHGSISYRNAPRDPLANFTVPNVGTQNLSPPGVMVMYSELDDRGQPILTYPTVQLAATTPLHPPTRFIMWGDWNLGDHPSYFVDGSMSNRLVHPQVTHIGDGISWGRDVFGNNMQVDEYGCGINMTNCVLTVNGDLDLCDTSNSNPDFHGITGNGATLIVNGTLSLTGAALRAGDQGMVILAKDIALSGSGTYNGLLIGLNSVSLITAPGHRLTIHGGIATGGATSVEQQSGVLLRNVDLTQDPRYMKSLNPFGDFQLTGWEPL